jgi:cellulose biosynthesis protein BcsQ
MFGAPVPLLAHPAPTVGKVHMLLSLWSPKGGSGTSVFTAACAITLSTWRPTRLVDLDGDQAAVLGLAPTGRSDGRGARDWLAAGPTAPGDALTRLALDAGPALQLVPAGARIGRAGADGEAGAALGVVLREWGTVVADCGRAEDDATRALVEVSDHSVVVVRACSLAVRRAAADELVARASGMVVLEEAGRVLGRHEVFDVLGVPVLATVPVRAAIGRVVDAGVLASRLPDQLARPARVLLERLGVTRLRDTAA